MDIIGRTGGNPSFLFFVLIEDNYDFVEIGSGDKPGYFHTREKVYSGSMAEDFLANYDSMWVTFTSDDANHGQGFEMTVNIGM